MKLDAYDMKILSELDKNCRITNSDLAKKVRKSRESIRYRIEKLEQEGIITGFITSINPTKLGYYMFKVYLKLENIPDEQKRFFDTLRERKDIYWLGISDGAFDCVFAILSPTITEYFEQINYLLSDWKHLIVSKVLGTMVDTQQYNKKFFRKGIDVQTTVFGGDVEKTDIDEIDSQILSILANDARKPIAHISKRTNVSSDIVRSRIARLEKKGVIISYRTGVDFNKLGLEFFKVIIYFRTLSQKDQDALFEWMRLHPKSLYFIRTIAPWDVEFEFAVENYQEFNSIVSDLRKKFPNVIRNHEHLIMKYETWMPAYTELFSSLD